jgi:hypothetical protein
MPAAEGVPLVKTFANAWRDQTSFGPSESAQLVEHMRQAVAHAHGAGALLVDGNEMNYLAHGVTPRVLDVDSWQIGHFQATALMPSIRDWHAAAFSTDSDWFSWGVVTFQIFTGIHPFKGTHPDFKRGDLEARMRAHISVFDPLVALNAAVRDFELIPDPLLAWYQAVFQHGTRGAPPSPLCAPVPAAVTRKLRVVSTPSATVRHERILSLEGPIARVLDNGIAIYGRAGAWHAFDLLRRRRLVGIGSSDIDAVLEGRQTLVRYPAGVLRLALAQDTIVGHFVEAEKEPSPTLQATRQLPCKAERLRTLGGRIFACDPHSYHGLVELALDVFGTQPVLSVRANWPVLVRSTRFFRDLAVIDALGAPFVMTVSAAALKIARAPDLKGLQIIDAALCGQRLAYLLGISKADGLTYRLMLALADDHCSVVDRQAVDHSTLNVAVTERGVSVLVLEDDTLQVAAGAVSPLKQVPHAGVDTSMPLFALPSGIHYAAGTDVFRISLS